MSSYGGLYTGPAYGGATDVGLPPVPGVVGPYVEPPIVVHLRGADAVRVGQIDDVVKLQLVVRHQDVGSWVLDLHPNSPTVQASWRRSRRDRSATPGLKWSEAVSCCSPGRSHGWTAPARVGLIG
jgi:hypothetical protein